jgi:hypothetical protein
MYQYSKSMRDASECGGCDRLKASPVYDGTGGNRALTGLEISAAEVSWPDAAGSTYNLLSKTNLLDSSWTTNQTGLSESPVVVPQAEDQEFYQVHVVH